MTNHDLKSVMACLTEKAAIMGTGPERSGWPGGYQSGLRALLRRLRQRRAEFEYQFKIGGVTADMGWLMASGNVTGKKDGKDFAFQ